MIHIPKGLRLGRKGNMKIIISKIISFIFYAYLIIGGAIFVPYFNWQYAKNNGFMKWLLLGEIIPTGKALIWPFFILPSKEKANFSHFADSMKYESLAVDMESEATGNSAAEKAVTAFGYWKRALDEANKTDVAILNKMYPNLGNKFQAEYIAGIEKLLKGYATQDIKMSDEATDMINGFAIWVNQRQVKDKLYKFKN